MFIICIRFIYEGLWCEIIFLDGEYFLDGVYVDVYVNKIKYVIVY